MKKFQVVSQQKKENFIAEIEKYVNYEGYKIVSSNMSMMNSNVSHIPAYFALLEKEVV